MYCSRSWPLAFLLAALLVASACTRKKNLNTGVERIAVGGLENLSDPRWDWIGAASAPLAVNAVAGSPKYFAAVGSDPVPLRARYKLEGYYEVRGETLRLRAILRDTVRQATAATAQAEGPLSGGPASLVYSMVSGLVSHQRTIRAAAPAAVEAFGRAQLSPDLDTRLKSFQQAVAADAGFVPAVAALSQILLQSGRAVEAKDAITRALATAPQDWDEITLRMLLARAEGNAETMQKVAERAADYWPSDTTVLLQLGGVMLQQHRYTDATVWLKKAALLEPGNTTSWNQLAYAQAYSGAYADAAESTAEYRRIAPNDPNAYDSSGEIAFYAGNFKEAETQFLESQLKAPRFLGGLSFSKAAFARFFAGDTAGADGLFQRYLETRRAQQDPLVELRQAHWLRLTGRSQEALSQAAKLSAGNAEIAARATALLSLWLVEDGKREQAADLVKLPNPKFSTPPMLGIAVMTGFLAQPHTSPEAWAQRSTQGLIAQIPPHTRSLVVAYALLLDGHAKAAAQLLDGMWRQSQPANNDEIRVLLGWLQLQLEDKAGAAQLLRAYPLPPQTGDAVFASLYLPEYLEWRKSAGL